MKRAHAELRRSGRIGTGAACVWSFDFAQDDRFLKRCHLELVEGSDAYSLSKKMKDYYVYILTNTAHVLYIGVTGNLSARFWEHVSERSSKFCSDYNLDRLVFYEIYPTAGEAIAREKQLKGWRREKKIWLIEAMNPAWKDLSGRFRD